MASFSRLRLGAEYVGSQLVARDTRRALDIEDALGRYAATFAPIGKHARILNSERNGGPCQAAELVNDEINWIRHGAIITPREIISSPHALFFFAA